MKTGNFKLVINRRIRWYDGDKYFNSVKSMTQYIRRNQFNPVDYEKYVVLQRSPEILEPFIIYMNKVITLSQYKELGNLFCPGVLKT